jgi:lipoate-protein ligase B
MEFIDLGHIDYQDCYQKQVCLHKKVVMGISPDTVFLATHPPVITKGRSYKKEHLIKVENVRSNNIPVLETDRGGSVTYHGPGQLICYPILNLTNYKKDIHKFLDKIEQITINTLNKYDINAISISGKRGVWVEKRKIASIGIAVRRWVTYHGIAVNLNTNLDYFDFINPCGYNSDIMTSLQKIKGMKTDIDEFKKHFVSSFKEVFT